MYRIYLTNNVRIILNENSKNKFKQDFATSFDEFKSIQTIYEEEKIVNYDFTNMDNDGIQKIIEALKNNLIGHNAFKKEFLKKLKNYQYYTN